MTLHYSGIGVTTCVPPKSVSEKLCLRLAQSFVTGPLKRFNIRQRALGARFESRENYVSDRVSNVESYRELFTKFCRFEGRTVLELGCSAGYLLAAFQRYEPFVAIGADIDRQALAHGRSAYGSSVTFIESTPSSIPLPDDSVDIVFTIDTVEHLSKPGEIFRECYRVLRPEGLCLVHFYPWLGPYGAHLEDIIPFPWPHIPFSMTTLLTVAAWLYESKDYTPAAYWLDPETGQRRPNPYLDQQRWREFLNHMTIRRFRRLVAGLPFDLIHFQRLGFGGKAFRMARLARGLAQVPGLDEFFANALFCVLKKPAGRAA